MASAKARLATKLKQNYVTSWSSGTIATHSNGFFRVFKLVWEHARLTTQEHFMICVQQHMLKMMFHDEKFKVMLRKIAQNENLPLISRKGLSYCVKWEFNVVVVFLQSCLEEKWQSACGKRFTNVFMMIRIFLSMKIIKVLAIVWWMRSVSRTMSCLLDS